ncbi:4-oxalocrotonate decarboxylase (plasmid) [Prescottella equi]|uniref:2-keto-4-pentenoate hydratase n=1 Tax=Rhodococcus hoagii TaxID=43767 RepID=UPI002575CA1A|nr:fumarylacetoacetate hydrolase family protein [Prescottella equi]WJJ14367.1 4-oxalocrotonate decarboxylase [Prescottella equi]
METETSQSVQAPAPSVDSLAKQLLRAEAERTALAPLTDTHPGLDIDLAYRIQDEALSQRIERGENIVGVKLGLTSPAKQRQMGVSAPLTAWLTDAMVLPAGVPVPHDRLIHPRVEPEITFVMGRRLSGPGVTAATAMAAVDQVYASLEIIDSRYLDFRFTLPDVIADNASSAYYATGPAGMSPATLDLSLEACLLEVDGRLAATGVGASVQGNPAEALAMAANSLALRGHAIEAGWIVMTGGMTDAVAAPAGSSIAAQFTNLGSVRVTS